MSRRLRITPPTSRQGARPGSRAAKLEACLCSPGSVHSGSRSLMTCGRQDAWEKVMRGLWAGFRGHVIVICALIGCSAGIAPAGAQPFPSRPITLGGPVRAGGPTDPLARILPERIAAELRTTVVVENVA